MNTTLNIYYLIAENLLSVICNLVSNLIPTNTQNPIPNIQQPTANTQNPIPNIQQLKANTQNPIPNSQYPTANSQLKYGANNPTTTGFNGINKCAAAQCQGGCGSNCNCPEPKEEELRINCDYICPFDLVIPSGYCSLTATNTGTQDLLKNGKQWACKKGDNPNEYCFPAKGRIGDNVEGMEITFSTPRTKEDIIADNESSLNDYTMCLDVSYPNTDEGKAAYDSLSAQLENLAIGS